MSQLGHERPKLDVRSLSVKPPIATKSADPSAIRFRANGSIDAASCRPGQSTISPSFPSAF